MGNTRDLVRPGEQATHSRNRARLVHGAERQPLGSHRASQQDVVILPLPMSDLAPANEELDLESIQTFAGKYPRQLWWLFFSEMWERFSFYGMRGVLTFFMAHELMMKED